MTDLGEVLLKFVSKIKESHNLCVELLGQLPKEILCQY
jgi:hypothetical protein